MTTYKICKSCGLNLEISCFTKSKILKGGYENKCKTCRQKQRKKHLNICKTCGKEWRTSKKNSKYCSSSCKPQSQKSRLTVICDYCGELIQKTPSQIKTRGKNYCSDKCKNEGYKIFHRGKNSVHYNRKEVLCSYCNNTILRTEYELNSYKSLYCSSSCKSMHHKIIFQGDRNPNYNPNISDTERIINRNISGYADWRNDVYNRDKYTCQCCGDKNGKNLNAHHIMNYSQHKNLRTDIDNGITFCKKCHKLFHDTYGYIDNNLEQLIFFLNKYKR